jgi:GTP cyclohydrolase II
MINKNWHIVDESEACSIVNKYGTFMMKCFEIEGPGDISRNILTLLHGQPVDGIALRLNSACLTSEVFGDRGCDCAWQLQAAMRIISREESGLLIYSPSDEGRGAGILRKLDSMALMQRERLSSAESFEKLGIKKDQRDYSYVGPILNKLGIKEVRCITNNPQKVAAIESEGVVVSARIEIVAKHIPELHGYLRDKIRQLDHVMELA